MALVPIRFVAVVTANVVPVEIVEDSGIGVVECVETVGPANVVPVRESDETPRVLIRLNV